MANVAVRHYQGRRTDTLSSICGSGRGAHQTAGEETTSCMRARRLPARGSGEVGRMVRASANTRHQPGRRLPHVELQPVRRESVQVHSVNRKLRVE